MPYATLMLHLDLGISNGALLDVTATLAGRFHADVIGICTCHPAPIAYGETYVSGDVIIADRDEIHLEDKTAESEFRAALSTHTKHLEWRTMTGAGSLADYVANQARSADLIITASGTGHTLDRSRLLNIGELVIKAGRPVLIVPSHVVTPRFEKVLVGWKDSPTARRALVDALPFLELAKQVTVAALTDDPHASGAHDVTAWLSRHGIAAESIVRPAKGVDGVSLAAIIKDLDADLLVAGAFGHNRLREWVWGGVTQDLLLDPQICCIVSH
jgi:nucleotide-binding universal stress UspA family protein